MNGDLGLYRSLSLGVSICFEWIITMLWWWLLSILKLVIDMIIILLLCYECGQYKVLRRKNLLYKPNEKSNIDPLNRPLCIKTCSSLTLHWSNNVAAESTVAFTGWTTDLINHFIKVWFLGSYEPYWACNYCDVSEFC